MRCLYFVTVFERSFALSWMCGVSSFDNMGWDGTYNTYFRAQSLANCKYTVVLSMLLWPMCISFRYSSFFIIIITVCAASGRVFLRYSFGSASDSTLDFYFGQSPPLCIIPRVICRLLMCRVNVPLPPPSYTCTTAVDDGLSQQICSVCPRAAWMSSTFPLALSVRFSLGLFSIFYPSA